MDKDDAKAILTRYWQAYVDELKPLMELRDWDVTVVLREDYEGDCELPAEDEATASAETGLNRRWATIILHPPFFGDRTAEERRQTIVHELLHLHFSQAWKFANGEALPSLVRELPFTAGRFWLDAWSSAMEYGIDAIAQGWADQLPLPPGDHSMTEREVEQLFDLEPGDVTREPVAPGVREHVERVTELEDENQALIAAIAHMTCRRCRQPVKMGTAHRAVDGKDECEMVPLSELVPDLETRAPGDLTDPSLPVEYPKRPIRDNPQG